HPSTVDVAQFQIDNLTYSQPHSVAQLQHQQMLLVSYHVEYPFYFLLAQHLWQSGWLLRPWDFGKEVRFMEHLFKIEFDGVEPAVQLAFRNLQCIDAIKDVSTETVVAEGINGDVFQNIQYLCKFYHVGPYGGRAVGFHLQYLFHALQLPSIQR